ncbi:hypothetical protein D9M72_237460 [compost metagenome]
MQPGPPQAHAELAVLDTQLQVAQVEAEQAEEANEVRLDEGNAFEEVQLVVSDGNVRQLLDLQADFREIGRQVLIVATAELPLDFGVRVIVQHRLHHGQFIEIGIQQVLDDAAGKGAVSHGRVSKLRGDGGKRAGCGKVPAMRKATAVPVVEAKSVAVRSV